MSSPSKTVSLCPGVLNLETSVRSIPDFQLGPPRIPDRADPPAELVVEYQVGAVEGLSGADKGIEIRDGTVVYKKELGLLGEFRCRIDVGDRRTKLTVNERFHRLGRRSVSSVPSVGTLLEDLIAVQLLSNGYGMLYCGGVSVEDTGVILMGPTNSGKTTAVLNLVREHGARYVAEDIAITDGQHLYCCPYAMSPIDGSHLRSHQHSVSRWLAERVPMLDSISVGSINSMYDILSRDQVTTSEAISRLYLLAPEGHQPPDRDVASTLALLNRAEFRYLTNQILLGADYLGYGIDVDGARAREERLFGTIAENSTVRHISGGYEQRYDQLVRETIAR